MDSYFVLGNIKYIPTPPNNIIIKAIIIIGPIYEGGGLGPGGGPGGLGPGGGGGLGPGGGGGGGGGDGPVHIHCW